MKVPRQKKRRARNPSWARVRDFVKATSPSGWSYLGPLADYAETQGLRPNAMPERFVDQFVAAYPAIAARDSFVNCAIRRFNEAANYYGLNPIGLLPTRNSVRAAANEAIHPNVLAEIKVRLDTLTIGDAAKGNIERRLLAIARRYADGGWPIESLVEIGDPLRLDALVRDYEADPGHALTIHTGRKRTLDDVANLLEDLPDCMAAVEAIRAMIAILPKAGLAAAAATADRVMNLDDETTDDLLFDTCMSALDLFVAKPGRSTFWAAQTSFGALIILQEVCDLDRIAEAWFEEEPAGAVRLLIAPILGQDSPVDVGAAEESGYLSAQIEAYVDAARVYTRHTPRLLFETKQGDQKKHCSISNDIKRFFLCIGADITPIALRDHVVQQNRARGLDDEGTRNLTGKAFVSNIMHRYAHLDRQRATATVVNAMETHHGR